eukprot:12974985-Alexandrium_andersonii.AAC.1
MPQHAQRRDGLLEEAHEDRYRVGDDPTHKVLDVRTAAGGPGGAQGAPRGAWRARGTLSRWAARRGELA